MAFGLATEWIRCCWHISFAHHVVNDQEYQYPLTAPRLWPQICSLWTFILLALILACSFWIFRVRRIIRSSRLRICQSLELYDSINSFARHKIIIQYRSQIANSSKIVCDNFKAHHKSRSSHDTLYSQLQLSQANSFIETIIDKIIHLQNGSCPATSIKCTSISPSYSHLYLILPFITHSSLFVPHPQPPFLQAPAQPSE